MATRKDPANCPISGMHERAVKPGSSCSMCGWAPLDSRIGARKTFYEGAWRVHEPDNSIGAKCEPPTSDERGRWAAEDKETGIRFPKMSEAPPPGTRVYKVVTQRDEWFAGQFDPGKLTERINELALDGWRVVAITAADVSTFFGTFWAGRGARQELVAFLEKEVS